MLHELQSGFSAMLFEERCTIDPGSLSTASRVTWDAGLDVYRNNLRAGLEAALGNLYPVVRRLVGDACFSGLCRQYCDAHPPRSGNVDDHGSAFPDFLLESVLAATHPYVPDIARLELARRDAAVAPDVASVAPELLADLNADDIENLRLHMHPSIRLVSSDYPILAIWTENQKPDNDIETLTLNPSVEHLLVFRRGYEVWIRSCSTAEAAFIKAAQFGYRLPLAFASACDIDPSLQLEPLLTFLIRNGLIGDYTVDHDIPVDP